MVETTRKSSSSKIYQLKITLLDSKPAIWRRVIIPHELNLADLHNLIQICMGWTDCHLHLFRQGQALYSNPKFKLNEDPKVQAVEENKIKLSQVFSKPKDALVYEYDFGDGWEHLIELEKFRKPSKNLPKGPACTEVEYSCPLEDSGGIHRYMEIMNIIMGPSNPEYDDLVDWIPRGFDPEYFDIWRVNYVLRMVFGW